MSPGATRAISIRWAILAVYALLAACTQLLWLSFAAIDTDSARVLHTDVGTIGDLAPIFPFIYVVLALPAAAGNLIAVLTAGGIIGAAALPPLVAARDQRRSMLIVALAFTAAAFAATDLRHDVAWLSVWLSATGFMLMACLPVVLDWSAVHAGVAREGAAAGFLLMSGNLGGVVLVLVIQAAMGNAYIPLAALAAVGVLGLPLALGLPGRRVVRALGTAAPE
jgi:hypothetical protein